MLKGLKEIDKCRSCEGVELVDIISLGNQYLTTFVRPGLHDDLPRAPLDLIRCTECGLVQLQHTTPPDLLYRYFWYQSGINETMRKALASVVSSTTALAPVSSGDLVIDIGSNDGTMLHFYDKEVRRVGFEPALNMERDSALEIIPDYFKYRDFGQKAKIISTIAMFYDLDMPNSFVADVQRQLADDGVWVNQLNQLSTMIETYAYDSICHEHLEYYSLRTLRTLYERHGLEIFHVTRNDINGGSMRVFAAKKGQRMVQDSVLYAVTSETLTSGDFRNFAEGVHHRAASLNTFLTHTSLKGIPVHVYGASTKGNVLLQFCNIDTSTVSAAADRNPEKWGLEMVGSWIPIISEQDSRRRSPGYYLVLPWAFMDEFKLREKSYLKEGGAFLVPLPDLRVVDSKGEEKVS